MIDQLKNKAFFLDVMSDIIHDRYSLRKIIFSYNSPRTEYTHPWIRVVIPTEGHLDALISQDYKMVNIRLNSGEILFCLTDGAFHSKSQAHCMASIIYWNELIRFLHEGDDYYWYHTSNPICESGQAVLKAILLLANKEEFQVKVALLVNALIHITYDELKEDAPFHFSKAYNTFQHILNYVSYNFHMPLNRQIVADAMKITPQHLSRLFKIYSDTSFNMTVKKMRLNYAVELLHSGRYSVNEVAECSGFVNVGYFITEFKKIFKSTPGKYQG
jgi:AraC-like DNA-binding protein